MHDGTVIESQQHRDALGRAMLSGSGGMAPGTDA
jgi:hypothetical protein